LGRWKAAGLDELVLPPASLTVSRTGETVVVTIVQVAACRAADQAVVHTHSYELTGDGGLLVRNHFRVDPAVDDLPRLGVTLSLPDDFETLEWFGRGPLETYIDRNRAARVGRWSGT